MTDLCYFLLIYYHFHFLTFIYLHTCFIFIISIFLQLLISSVIVIFISVPVTIIIYPPLCRTFVSDTYYHLQSDFQFSL